MLRDMEDPCAWTTLITTADQFIVHSVFDVDPFPNWPKALTIVLCAGKHGDGVHTVPHAYHGYPRCEVDATKWWLREEHLMKGANVSRSHDARNPQVIKQCIQSLDVKYVILIPILLWIYKNSSTAPDDEFFLILSVVCTGGRHRALALCIWWSHLLKMVNIPSRIEFNSGWKSTPGSRLCKCNSCNTSLLRSAQDNLWEWRRYSAPQVLRACNEYWQKSRPEVSLAGQNQFICDFARQLEESPLVNPDKPTLTR